MPIGVDEWTILEVVRWTTTRFSGRGIASARLDAELLAAHAFGLSRVELYTQFDRPLHAGELAVLRALVKRRQAGQPVAYLTGRKEFWSLDLMVNGDVLVPRPETETLVEIALEHLAPATPARAVDVGTGSGAIALAIKKSRPAITVLATDISAAALAVAGANAARLNLAVDFRHGDLLAPVAAEAPFDLIAANLPYVPTAQISTLAPEVRAEPRAALDGGADGLGIIRRLINAAGPLLAPEGMLLLEIGAGQAGGVASLCRAAGFTRVHARADLAGIERAVSARAHRKATS